MSELLQIQAAAVEVLKDARNERESNPTADHATSIAVELFCIAFCMKPAYRAGGLKVAKSYCEIVNIDADATECMTLEAIRAIAINQSESEEARDSNA
jgi:hypothetical protein